MYNHKATAVGDAFRWKHCSLISDKLPILLNQFFIQSKSIIKSDVSKIITSNYWNKQIKQNGLQLVPLQYMPRSG